MKDQLKSSKKVIIGLESHITVNMQKEQFLTNCSKTDKTLIKTFVNTKLFCNCSFKIFCQICSGEPGAIPQRVNNLVLEKAILLSKILKCKISRLLLFDRKAYLYNDLLKGFQITQKRRPIATRGQLEIFDFNNWTNSEKIIRIKNLIVEEDPAQLKNGTPILSRSGRPLIELVTEPNFSNHIEVLNYLKTLKKILYLYQISDCRVKGSLKTDVNISLENSNFRVEIKNLNSFKLIKEAIISETTRLEESVLETNETREFKSSYRGSKFLRPKELSGDYLWTVELNIPPRSLQKLNKKTYLPKSKDSFERFKKIIQKKPLLKTHSRGLFRLLDFLKDQDLLKINSKIIDLFERVFKFIRYLYIKDHKRVNFKVRPLIRDLYNYFIRDIDTIDSFLFEELFKEFLQELVKKDLSFSQWHSDFMQKNIRLKKELDLVLKDNFLEKLKIISKDCQNIEAKKIKNYLIGQLKKYKIWTIEEINRAIESVLEWLNRS